MRVLRSERSENRPSPLSRLEMNGAGGGLFQGVLQGARAKHVRSKDDHCQYIQAQEHKTGVRRLCNACMCARLHMCMYCCIRQLQPPGLALLSRQTGRT